jgi:hypothetical protein
MLTENHCVHACVCVCGARQPIGCWAMAPWLAGLAMRCWRAQQWVPCALLLLCV